MRQSQLVNWYLSEIEGDIDSVEMLAEKKVLVEKVIERLTHHVREREGERGRERGREGEQFHALLVFLQDHVLLPLMVEEEEEHKGNPLLVVHPNYTVET